LKEAIQADLERCQLSVHLIGTNYAFIPEGDQRSVARLQNDIAAQRSTAQGLQRLIWLPPDLSPNHERQQRFVEYLQNDSGAQDAVDVIQASLEELKTVIQDRLKTRKGQESTSDSDAELTRIYLVFDDGDFEAVTPLSDYLYDQGFEVLTPVFEGDAAEVREDHTDKLVSSDAILVYQGIATDLWLSAKLRDLRKLPGYAGARPKHATAIYFGPPATKQKERLKTREAMIVKGFDQFSPTMLDPFMSAIAGATKGISQP
jgi:hypothetical protein